MDIKEELRLIEWSKPSINSYDSTSNGGKTIHIHRRVWIEYNGEIPEGYMIHHIDGNKKNNSIDNLKLVTRKEHGELHHIPNRIRVVYPSGISVRKIK